MTPLQMYGLILLTKLPELGSALIVKVLLALYLAFYSTSLV